MSNGAHFTSGLEPTLAEISRIASQLQDDWWIIGSAAIALAGAAIEVPDVDLLVSERDARALLTDWASPRSPGRSGPSGPPSGRGGHEDDRLRAVYGRHAGTMIPIEIAGRLEIYIESRWVAVTPTTREAIDLPGGRVYIPDVADQLALLLMCRRPQDLVRAEILIGLA